MAKKIDKVIKREDAIAYIIDKLPDCSGIIVADMFNTISLIKNESAELINNCIYHPGSDTITYTAIEGEEEV